MAGSCIQHIGMQLSSCRTQAANHSGSMCSYQQVGGRPGVLSYPTRPANPAASAAVRSRRGGLTCLARRTKSGGGERDTKQATNATSNSTASSRSTTPPPSKNSQDNRSNTPSRNSKQQVSQLEAFIRDTPVLNRFLDGTLILGDAVMLVATEASSERLPVEQIPALAAVAVGSWVIAGAILGDYTMEPGQPTSIQLDSPFTLVRGMLISPRPVNGAVANSSHQQQPQYGAPVNTGCITCNCVCMKSVLIAVTTAGAS